ncbi:MAG: oligosaccharide flippase family protein [Dysgonamonadaceae bacterium]|nr:oligosaccharide flippase family protein [Dysgonamonadaceae bacterium]
MIRIQSILREASKQLLRTGFFHIFGSNVLNKIIGFISGVVIVRILSKSEYGVYTYANNIYSFFLLLSGFGITSGVLQLCSEANDEEHQKNIRNFGMRFGITFNICLALIIIGVASFLKFPIDGSNILLAMMSFLPVVMLISDIQGISLRVRLKNKEYAQANTFGYIIMLFASCLLSILFKVPGLVLASYLTQIAKVLFMRHRFNETVYTRRLSLDKSDRKVLFSISSISMLNNGLSTLMYLLDIFILGLIIQNEDVIAAYKIATIIPNAMNIIPDAVLIYIYPYFARNKNNGTWLRHYYKRLLLILGTFNLLVSILMFVTARPCIQIVFGEQYLDAIVPFRLLSISYFFSATFRIISGNILVTQRKLKFNLGIAALSGSMNTIMNIFMIQAWESNGAALATLITVFVTGFISTLYLYYVFKHVGYSDER